MRSAGAHAKKKCYRRQRHFATTFFFSTDHTKQPTHCAFDRSRKLLQRDNAARAHQAWRTTTTTGPNQHYHNNDNNNSTVVVVRYYDYLRDELAHRLIDRLDDIRRDEGFPLALDLGAGAGHVYRAICADDALQEAIGGGIGGVRKLVQLDSSRAMLHRDDDYDDEENDTDSSSMNNKQRCATYKLVADEEARLPFPDGTFDLVTSCASMHWVNQLPAVLTEIRRVLKPDGCFLWAMLGGANHLSELRASLVLAEQERDGGVSPHVGPFVQLADVGALLQRAGFALPTVDTDTWRLGFPNAAVLMEHLQRMGESNAALQRRERTSVDTFLAASCLYDHLFRGRHHDDDDDEEEGEHHVEASVQVIYAIGWTPHESQQKPKARGSATHKVGEVVLDKHSKKEGE